MIHYALRCDAAHEFDGWFKSSASFDDQARAGLLECPVCACTTVERALMAPSISPRAQAPAALSPPDTAPGPAPNPKPAPSVAPAHPAAQMIAVLQRVRAEIEKTCQYVGPHFARDVRRMADRQEPSRPIYGEATADEAADLAQDGIEVACIPWVPRAES